MWSQNLSINARFYTGLILAEVIFWRDFLSLGFIFCDFVGLGLWCGAQQQFAYLTGRVRAVQHSIHVMATTGHRDEVAWEFLEEQEEAPPPSTPIYNAL